MNVVGKRKYLRTHYCALQENDTRGARASCFVSETMKMILIADRCAASEGCSQASRSLTYTTTPPAYITDAGVSLYRLLDIFALSYPNLRPVRWLSFGQNKLSLYPSLSFLPSQRCLIRPDAVMTLKLLSSSHQPLRRRVGLLLLPPTSGTDASKTELQGVELSVVASYSDNVIAIWAHLTRYLCCDAFKFCL